MGSAGAARRESGAGGRGALVEARLGGAGGRQPPT